MSGLESDNAQNLQELAQAGGFADAVLDREGTAATPVRVRALGPALLELERAPPAIPIGAAIKLHFGPRDERPAWSVQGVLKACGAVLIGPADATLETIPAPAPVAPTHGVWIVSADPWRAQRAQRRFASIGRDAMIASLPLAALAALRAAGELDLVLLDGASCDVESVVRALRAASPFTPLVVAGVPPGMRPILGRAGADEVVPISVAHSRAHRMALSVVARARAIRAVGFARAA